MYNTLIKNKIPNIKKKIIIKKLIKNPIFLFFIFIINTDNTKNSNYAIKYIFIPII